MIRLNRIVSFYEANSLGVGTHIESYTVEWAALVLLVLFWVFHGARNLVILQLGMTIHIVLVFEVILSFTVLTLIISQSTLLL